MSQNQPKPAQNGSFGAPCGQMDLIWPQGVPKGPKPTETDQNWSIFRVILAVWLEKRAKNGPFLRSKNGQKWPFLGSDLAMER